MDNNKKELYRKIEQDAANGVGWSECVDRYGKEVMEGFDRDNKANFEGDWNE